MIALMSDCLLFEVGAGEKVPLSAEMLVVDLPSEMARAFDAGFVENVAKAVFHYFKHDLSRQTVTMGEFAAALEKALRGFKLDAPAPPPPPPAVVETNLCRLAQESGEARELFFFPRLRAELRQHLRKRPSVLRFHSLRPCVMHLAGARRWSPRCRGLEEQIVAYLRGCFSAEVREAEPTLVVV
jgi:hypothetical protein